MAQGTIRNAHGETVMVRFEHPVQVVAAPEGTVTVSAVPITLINRIMAQRDKAREAVESLAGGADIAISALSDEQRVLYFDALSDLAMIVDTLESLLATMTSVGA